MSKGSLPRPFEISQKMFETNWDAVFSKKTKTIDERFCEHPNHFLDTMSISLPPDEIYLHKCPGCGQENEFKQESILL